MSIKLHELNRVEVNERELGSMKNSSLQPLHGFPVAFFTFHRIQLSLPRHPFLFLSSFDLFSSFVFSLSFSLSLPLLLSLSRYIIDIEHIYESFSRLQRTDDLSSASVPLSYLSVCFISIPSPQANLQMKLFCTVQMEPIT